MDYMLTEDHCSVQLEVRQEQPSVYNSIYNEFSFVVSPQLSGGNPIYDKYYRQVRTCVSTQMTASESHGVSNGVTKKLCLMGCCCYGPSFISS